MKLTSCIYPVIDHEFHHNIVKGRLVDPQTTLTMLYDEVYNRTGAYKTDIQLFSTITNCQIVRSRSLPHRICYGIA